MTVVAVVIVIVIMTVGFVVVLAGFYGIYVHMFM